MTHLSIQIGAIERQALIRLLTFVPQLDAVILETAANGSIIRARPVRGGRWRIESTVSVDAKVTIYGDLPSSPDKLQVRGIQKAVELVVQRDHWKTSFEVDFGADEHWLLYSLRRQPKVVGGARMVMFHKKTGEVKVAKDY